jgi:hypothetical protein
LTFDLLWAREHDGPAVQRVRDAAARAAAVAGWGSAQGGRGLLPSVT